MYRHSPGRNPRSKGIKIKHVVQVCLLLAVCFWLIFQVKRSHDKRKQFDANEPKISLSNTRAADEIFQFGRKDLQPKLEETNVIHEETQEDEDEHEQEEVKQDEDKIEEEKDDGGGGGDDEIDETELEKANMEIEREEVDIIDEDKEIEESDEKENEERDGESQTENRDEHDEDGSAEHTHEAREEQYKADDASSAVITHHAENESRNATSESNSLENGETHDNGTIFQNKSSESIKAASSIDSSHENGPPLNATLMTSNSTSVGYRFDSNVTVTEITQGPSYSNDLERLPEIETENGNSEETAAE